MATTAKKTTKGPECPHVTTNWMKENNMVWVPATDKDGKPISVNGVQAWICVKK